MDVQGYFWMDCRERLWMKLENEIFHKYARDQSRRVAPSFDQVMIFYLKIIASRSGDLTKIFT